MKTSKLKYNPNNPRRISQPDLDRLKKSISQFPEMMKLRPMVYDPETMQILGGNQRLAAIKALDMKEIPDEWAIPANELTDSQKKEFVLKDNISLGEWDFEVLAAEFSEFDIDEIGIIEHAENEEKPLIDEKGKEIKPITKVHYLISVDLDSVIDVKETINKLKDMAGVEVEQSQN